MKVIISKGNAKLGKAIPNISLIPVKDCGNCGACKSDCYAVKAWKRYPQTHDAWRTNSLAFRQSPRRAVEEVSAQLSKKNKPRFFRIHVAGDFLGQSHVDAWSWLASEHPGTKFLAFTKMHDLDYSGCPPNLQIILSMWPGLEIPDTELPRAWVTPDDRIPQDAMECPGNCEACGFCWNLSSIGRDIYFERH